MKRRDLLKGLAGGAATLAFGSRLQAQQAGQQAAAIGGATTARPNILWLVIEDTSAWEFGCYGNTEVKTPVIDGLAARGVRFNHAWAAGPQCSPSRASIITGSFGTTYGMDWHRRTVQVPDNIFFPPLLRQAGYFCTNNSKTDYNANVDANTLWDENNAQATYNSPARRPDQPFYSVFNCNATHMSRLRSFTLAERRDFATEGLDPQKLTLPAHVPDLPEIRSDYAYHLEGVQDIDGWVNVFLQDLKAKGLDEDTIVFFSSDHGGCLPRGKGFVYETGLRVPLVAYVPPKFRSLTNLTPGTTSDRLVHLMDLSPTFLSLAGVQPPAWMQGRAIMGRYEAPTPQYQYGFAANQAEHFVPARGVSDGRFHLVRSYTPHKPYSLRNSFQWGMPSNLAWDAYALSGQASPEYMQPYRAHPGEMLFDLQADPSEVHDLASSPEHRATLTRLRAALDNHLHQTRDLGLFPPSARHANEGIYKWTQETNYPLDALLDAAKLAASPSPQSMTALTGFLGSDKPEIRFWGASGMATLAEKTPGLTPPALLVQAVGDQDAYVAAEAAHALCYMGQAKTGVAALMKSFSSNSAAAFSALETLALTPVGREALRPYVATLQKPAVAAAVEAPVAPASDDEAGGTGFRTRAILVNLGVLPAARLYGAKEQRAALNINTGRKPLTPLPQPKAMANEAQPSDATGAAATAPKAGKKGGKKRKGRKKKQPVE